MTDRLHPDQTLAPDQSLVSADGKITLVMQGDGNLVVYEVRPVGNLPLWASATDLNPGARAIMQGDGNLVVYAPDDTPLWASATDGNPGAYLLAQDDMNLVVYAPDDAPLWATDTWLRTKRVGLTAAQHGFRFSNNFVNKVATVPGFGNVETRGRCGGMAYATLDYFLAGVPIPAYTASNFAPSTVPPDGHWLADYLYARLMNSFFNGSALRFPDWTVHSDHATWLYKGVTRWTKEEEFSKLVAAIDAGGPAVLGLVGATNLQDIGNKNHQVVAYGYDYHPGAGYMTVCIYDNNSPGVEVLMSSDPDTAHWMATNGAEWRGFFVHDYAHRNPPVFTTRPATTGQAVRYGDTVKIGHVWTGRTLHSHAFNYGHPGSSGQQQVTAFEGTDDNDWWRVKGPDGQPDAFRQGQPVANGDVVRLQHVATARNLHSHAGFPSPVTGQQEATCFGDNGVGDDNDDWRVETDGVGTWQGNRRLKLIHVPTNCALHSHPGQSHAQWTRGQQEVTCYQWRDDNDWWLLLEVE